MRNSTAFHAWTAVCAHIRRARGGGAVVGLSVQVYQLQVPSSFCQDVLGGLVYQGDHASSEAKSKDG
ncbi:unnamed protein product, partial [Clonostachys rosea f. rosea IK726]